MSKEGLPVVGDVDAHGLRVAVVTSSWNREVCDQLHERAVARAREFGAEVSEYRAVGALELPVLVQEAAKSHDAVVALGCVVRGGTPHFDYVCDSVTQGLTRIALDFSIPVGNGVLTVNTYEQAVARAGFADSEEDKGSESMEAALATALTLAQMRGSALDC